MQIQLNGQPKTLDAGVSLAELLHQIGLDGRRLAVEINGDIVPAATRGQCLLAPGDRVEIVHAIGGGEPEKARALLAPGERPPGMAGRTALEFQARAGCPSAPKVKE